MNILMTVEELAKYLKIKPDTIYKKVRKGELPAIKLGKLLRFPKELIDQWILEQAHTTAKAKKIITGVEKTARAAQKVVAHDTAELIEDMKKASFADKPEVLRKGLKGLWEDLSREVQHATPLRKGAKKAKKAAGSKAPAVKKNSAEHLEAASAEVEAEKTAH